MSRTYNNLHWKGISAALEVNSANPIDYRTVVDSLADLTNASTFVSGSDNTSYPGMVVAVIADSTASNNGVYYLKPDTTAGHTLPASRYAENWVKLAGMGNTNTVYTGVASTEAPSSHTHTSGNDYYLYTTTGQNGAITGTLYTWDATATPDPAWVAATGLVNGDSFVDTNTGVVYTYAGSSWYAASVSPEWQDITI